MSLCLEHVSMGYGGARVLQNANLRVASGTLLGLIGPNGAGKTTLLRIAAGLVRPRSGQVLREGSVMYFGGESTMPSGCRADRWAALLDATSRERRRLRHLSRGRRQIEGLSASLWRDDWTVGLLDEPWEGLDPDGARWLTRELERHRLRGAAIVVSSHRLHDVSDACTAFAFLVRGQVRLPGHDELSPTGGRIDAAVLLRLFDRMRQG